MPFKIQRLQENAIIPQRAYPSDSGMDLHCVENFTLLVGEHALIKTGIAVEMPTGYELQIRPRSGLALKQGITVLNSPGTIDASYRGEIGVILKNFDNEPHSFKAGDKIAQMVISKVELVDFVEVDALNNSDRGKGGFGSTGVSL
jgi:dUTP pyrophosphatase